MEKIFEQRTETVRVYVAKDGRKFDREEDCRKWEESYLCTLEKSWKALQKTRVNAAESGIPYGNEDDECYAVLPRDLDDVVLINAYIKAHTGDGLLTSEQIGKITLINFGCCRDWCGIYDPDEILKDVAKNLDKAKAFFNEEDSPASI